MSIEKSVLLNCHDSQDERLYELRDSEIEQVAGGSGAFAGTFTYIVTPGSEEACEDNDD